VLGSKQILFAADNETSAYSELAAGDFVFLNWCKELASSSDVVLAVIRIIRI
jgi:hypothetical protein